MRSFVLAAWLGLAALAGAQDAPEAGGIQWVGDWDQAVAQAKAESRPIMIHFNMDDEPACAGIARQHLRDPEVIKLSRKFVCVVCSIGEHSEESIFPGDEGKCRRFGCVTCAQHKKTDFAVRSEVMESNTVTAPQFVFTTPDLEILVRRPWDLPKGELLELMNRALRYFDPSLSSEEQRAQRMKVMAELFDLAASDNQAKRRQALDSLAKRDDPEVIKFLLAQTNDSIDLTKRIEAVKAIGEAQNANAQPRLLEMIGDRSARLRKHVLIALLKLRMAESGPKLVKAYGTERNKDNQALIVRAALASAPLDKGVRKLLAKALKARADLVRRHTVAATRELESLTAKEYERVLKMGRSDSKEEVRGVALWTATEIGILRREPLGDDEPESAAGLRKSISKKLEGTLEGAASKDREERIRELAKACLAALKGEGGDIAAILDTLHDEEELLNDDAEGGRRNNRGGRGGRRR